MFGMGVYYKKMMILFFGRQKDFFINQHRLGLKASNELDKTYDKHTKKYFESLLECMKFLEKDHSAYLVIKKRKIKGIVYLNLSKNHDELIREFA